MVGALSLLAYSIGRVFFDADPAIPVIGRTMSFAVLSLSQVVHTFNMRSDERSVFDPHLAKNAKLIPAAVICTMLQAAVIAIGPLSRIFKTVVLNGPQWLTVALLSFVPLAVVEAEKAISRKNRKHHRSLCGQSPART